ncbi:exo-alpha-sialidase [Streptomyces sp. NPDC091281]|uniref:sialidase family protein n=1 Tax=Streptomyces sp. NPDC091281 TaxID=3365985 RepID=UPI0037F68409
MSHLRRSLLAAAVLLSPFTSASGAAAAGRRTTTVPFAAGQDGYASFRIPAVVRTPRGTLLAFAEGRHDGPGDTGDIDLVVRRSTDGGQTWSPLGVVLPGGGHTRGNPAPVVDPRTGDLVLVSCSNHGDVTEAQIMRGEVTPEQGRRVHVQFSRDDGLTFTDAVEITDRAKLPEWRWYATGPGHAVALTRGPHAGRLVVPANHSAPPPPGSADTGREYRYYAGHSLLSDDGGRTWRIGFVDGDHDGTANVNESIAAELPDGTLYFNARDQGGAVPGNRLDARSTDGGETLVAPYAAQPTLADAPVVQGSVLQLEGFEAPLLFSAPSRPTVRQAMAIWRSTDAGLTFTRTLTLSDQPAAYSDLVQIDARTIGLLYETGTDGPYERIEFQLVGVGEV